MKKILLAEDDSFLIEIYSTKLKEASFKVEIAVNGEETLKKLQEEKPDLLLLDIVLPQIDGWEILKRVKENPALNNLKIIAFSNLGQKDDVEKGLKLGATKYLIKANYTPSQVVKEVKEVLEQAESM